MAYRKSKVIGLDELDLTNNDIFIRKDMSKFGEDSQVIVDETHVAILLKNGIALETLKPGIYPIFDKKSLFSRSADISRVELFYISKTAKLKVLWGTPALFDIHDPITDTPAKMGANGEIEIRVKNPRQFYIEIVGTDKKYTTSDLKERLKGRILSLIEPNIIEYVAVNSIALDKIAENKNDLAYYVQKQIGKVLSHDYGLEVSSLIISNVNIGDKYIDKSKVRLSSKEGCCRECGAKLVEGSKFCSNCGARI